MIALGMPTIVAISRCQTGRVPMIVTITARVSEKEMFIISTGMETEGCANNDSLILQIAD